MQLPIFRCMMIEIFLQISRHCRRDQPAQPSERKTQRGKRHQKLNLSQAKISQQTGEKQTATAIDFLSASIAFVHHPWRMREVPARRQGTEVKWSCQICRGLFAEDQKVHKVNCDYHYYRLRQISVTFYVIILLCSKQLITVTKSCEKIFVERDE